MGQLKKLYKYNHIVDSTSPYRSGWYGCCGYPPLTLAGLGWRCLRGKGKSGVWTAIFRAELDRLHSRSVDLLSTDQLSPPRRFPLRRSVLTAHRNPALARAARLAALGATGSTAARVRGSPAGVVAAQEKWDDPARRVAGVSCIMRAATGVASNGLTVFATRGNTLRSRTGRKRQQIRMLRAGGSPRGHRMFTTRERGKSCTRSIS
jgi:hypothetical protein